MTTTIAPEVFLGTARPVRLAARAEGITKEYGAGATRVVALDHVDLEVPRGEFTAIMGPSGSGKSTLLYCMAGLERVTRGHAYIGDVDITALDDRRLTQLRRDHIGFVFQAYNLVPTLTAAENITLPLAIAHRRPDQVWLDSVIDTVGLRDRLAHRPAELSGGQQQRVAAARALITKPDIVFADEPSGNLDSRSGAQLLEFMRQSVRTYGQTIVMVTHDPIIATYADRVVFLKDGAAVDGMSRPTVDGVLHRMSTLEG
ncbi:MAG TPA: ABC transporter ATP-binding protein [Candidatus Dormibacteraeota bacterium]|nr:ABC transporter ATP-binding protein [Candidatus Dormibacteraeota bacterium]